MTKTARHVIIFPSTNASLLSYQDWPVEARQEGKEDKITVRLFAIVGIAVVRSCHFNCVEWQIELFENRQHKLPSTRFFFLCGNSRRKVFAQVWVFFGWDDLVSEQRLTLLNRMNHWKFDRYERFVTDQVILMLNLRQRVSQMRENITEMISILTSDDIMYITVRVHSHY